MKAYRGDDGKIRLFRPMENMRRLNRSADRACLPVSQLVIKSPLVLFSSAGVQNISYRKRLVWA